MNDILELKPKIGTCMKVSPSIDEMEVTALTHPLKTRNTVYEIISELKERMVQYEAFLKKLEEMPVVDKEQDAMKNNSSEIPGW